MTNQTYPKIQALYKSRPMTNMSHVDWTINLQLWFCTKKSAGCKNCYMLNSPYKNNIKSKPGWREKGVAEFYKIPPGAVVFLGDMYDLYHEQNKLEWIQRTHKLIASRPDITVLLLTKRPEHIAAYADLLCWPSHLWLGVTVEDNNAIERIAMLKRLPTDNLWLSCEPLLEDISERLTDQQLRGVKWVIGGGESGPRRRPFNKRWAENLRIRCERNGVPFFYKQSSGQYPGHDPYLEGKRYFNFPDGISPLKYREPIEPAPVPVQLDMFND